MEARIPFPGLYHSYLDAELDSQWEREVEYYEMEGQKDCPKEYQADSEELQNLLFDCCDWQKAHRLAVEGYFDVFVEEFNQLLPRPINLTFVTMTSPRFYNFQTDRIFAEISEADARWLYNHVDKEAFDDTIRELFTSRSGFHSFYPNDLADWPPIEEWDHNHLYALLQAWIDDDFEERVMFGWFEAESSAEGSFCAALDWPKFQKELELIQKSYMPGVEVLYRCDKTIDMLRP